MACCNSHFFRPFSRKGYFDPHLVSRSVQIPCGFCLNCRVDRTNQWSDRAKWELKTKLTSSFVTLTYNDIWLKDSCLVPDLRSDGKWLFNLDYSHLRKFVHRVRSRVKYFYRKNPDVPVNALMRPDFSWICTGEYGQHGSKFDRPHFHILFFGLDFAFCKKMFGEAWKFGFITVLPLLDGGIKYVLKYMEKQESPDMRKEKYTAHGIDYPRQIQSRSFGTGLYWHQKDDILKHYYTYQSGHVRRPVPPYFKNLFYGYNRSFWNDSVSLEAYHRNLREVKNTMRTVYHLRDCSDKAVFAFKRRQADLRERKLRQKILNTGVGVMDYSSDNNLYYSPNYEKIRKLPLLALEALADDYRDSISIGGIT